MKTLPAAIGFATGIVIATAACSVFNAAREARRRVQRRSDVDEPMLSCLDDVVRTQDGGDAALARQKTRLLRQRWSEYLNDGPSPELFATEVIDLAPAATRPAP